MFATIWKRYGFSFFLYIVSGQAFFRSISEAGTHLHMLGSPMIIAFTKSASSSARSNPLSSNSASNIINEASS